MAFVQITGHRVTEHLEVLSVIQSPIHASLSSLIVSRCTLSHFHRQLPEAVATPTSFQDLFIL
jgi:hypothetical protein